MQKTKFKNHTKKAENSVINTGILVDKLNILSDSTKRKKIKSINTAFITSANYTVNSIFEKAKRLAVRSFVGVI